jgi:hypothetical protein
MARQLNFAAGPLAKLAAATALAALLCVALAVHVAQTGVARGLLRLIGAEAGSALMALFTALSLMMTVAALRRLLGDRAALAIREDGVFVSGLFLSRFVPWREIGDIRLRTSSYGGRTNHYVKVECVARPAHANPIHHALAEFGYGTHVGMTGGSAEDAQAWVAEAWQARVEALRPRARPAPAIAPAPPAQARAAGGFGRRVA